MPENTVYVGRGTRWGNPCRIVPAGKSGPFNLERDGVGFIGQYTSIEAARQSATDRYVGLILSALVPSVEEIQSELTGKNLACWCPLDQPCHADVLLQLASKGQPTASKRLTDAELASEFWHAAQVATYARGRLDWGLPGYGAIDADRAEDIEHVLSRFAELPHFDEEDR